MEDKDGDDDDDDEIEHVGARKRQRPVEADMTLACLFYKKDRRLNGSCCGKRLSRIRDVKQHLKRRHYMPIYCPICYNNFLDETTRDSYTNEMACERGSHLASTRNSKVNSARGRLGNTQKKSSDYSAYIDASLMPSAMAYRAFVTACGLEILHHVLAARGAISWNVPSGQDLET
ncbi:hypothetical protein CTA2_3144 [Colletotrichum tanaceti]|uniref:C2H2-type domain-containing protein n=1 Tax=Colletotrichum tanaceti TaxID=1306861 RepID=A0A4U6XLC9_9PEZI|nr:hypothetical protein CTA2_3144 [Colletotrichum tanaceti]TKW56451.1 hypothetical protein CTA1_11071 [Colletotrichum tanaceti]